MNKYKVKIGYEWCRRCIHSRTPTSDEFAIRCKHESPITVHEKDGWYCLSFQSDGMKRFERPDLKIAYLDYQFKREYGNKD